MPDFQHLRRDLRIHPPVQPGTRTPVSSIMTSPVIRATCDTSIDAIADIFLARGISAVPIVDDAGRPIGMVSKTDLLREHRDAADNEERMPEEAHPPLEPGMHEERLARATAAEVMTPMVFTVAEQTPISLAAALMSFERIHRVIVVDDAGVAVGVVSTLDILEWLAMRDGFVFPRDRRRER